VARNGELRDLGGVKTVGGDALNEIPGGTEEEFARFYREAYPSAVRLAWLLTDDHGAVEDIVQDAFVQLHARQATVEHAKAYLRAAIVNGCRRRARSAGRARTGLRRVSLTAEVSSIDRPSELFDAIARLPYRHRAVLALRYWADLPEAEIAEIVGIRPATVRSINVRALARLKKELPNE
jgi:RNA polymerase sigma factor (sigma-70 family)